MEKLTLRKGKVTISFGTLVEPFAVARTQEYDSGLTATKAVGRFASENGYSGIGLDDDYVFTAIKTHVASDEEKKRIVIAKGVLVAED